MARIVRKKPFIRKRPCQFCISEHPIAYVDYKNEEILANLVNQQGKILSSRITGTCAKHQRAVALAIKRARFVAILPYIGSIKKDRTAKKDNKVETNKPTESSNKENQE